MNDTFDGLDAFAAGLTSAFRSQRALHLIGLGAERIIQKRTREGISSEGSTFRPYSPAYARVRQREGLPTDRVNLQRSLYDGMLSKLDHVVAADLSAVDVLINDPRKAQIARYHTVPGEGRVYRPFLALAPNEEQQVMGLADELLQSELDALLSIRR